MPTTIPAAFEQFHSRLTPTQREVDAASRHRSSIEACLKRNFTLNRFFQTGSFGNGTSISGYSDVDYFAEIGGYNLPLNSATLLDSVARALRIQFPTTGVRVNSPAVSVPFGVIRAEHTEVVPAKHYGTSGNSKLYQIADGNGGWTMASPDAHNSLVAYENDRLSKRLKRLVRFLKAWKYFKTVPILSFYLELYVTDYAQDERTIEYDIDTHRILRKLYNSGLADVYDPAGVSGFIPACTTSSRKTEAKSKLSTAFGYAEKAMVAKRASNVRDQFYYWGLVFGDNFPSYG